jgi:glycosyltransferase involved in cell wall biosynthesis
MNKDPLISIVMNCYNGEKYLEESLKSVLNQTYVNWELIFWDNLSTDNSKKVFQSFNDKRFKYYLANKHTVLYEARNLAIQKTKGEFIAFLDTDDVWFKDKLDLQINLFSKKNIGLVYTNYINYNKKNFFIKKKLASKKPLPFGNITKKLIKEYSVGMLTVMIKKKLLDNHQDIFDVKFDMLADMDFILRFSKKTEFGSIQEPLAIYRQHENQLQNKNLGMQVEQMLKWYEKIKISKEFGEEKDLSMIKNRCKFFQIIEGINKKHYLKSLKEIMFFPSFIGRVKLFFMLILPRIIFDRIISLR